MSYKTNVRGILLLVGGFAIASGLARAEIIEQVLVKVNGEILTKTDLENRQIARLREQGSKIDLKSDPNDEQLRKTLDQITPQILVDAVSEMLVVQRGKELGYTISDAQFKSIVDNIRKQNKLDNEEQFQAALKQENMTLAELRRNLERSVISQRVEQNEVIGKIAMTEEEARAYYDAHLQEFTTPASITLREILIVVPVDPRGANVAADEAAKARADAIRARALAGDSFEKLAADLSEAPSRANAGLIGPLPLNDLSSDLKKMFEAMKPGDVAEPLRIARGYQILKLESVTASQTMPFEQAREQISNHVLTDKRRQEFDKYIEKLRSQAIIEWKNEDIKKAYQEGLKRQAAAPVPAPSH